MCIQRPGLYFRCRHAEWTDNWISHPPWYRFGAQFTTRYDCGASLLQNRGTRSYYCINQLYILYYQRDAKVSQIYGGAILIAVAQNIFSNEFIIRLTKDVPDIDPIEVINSGATVINQTVGEEKFGHVLSVFMYSLKDVYIIPIALNGMAFSLALSLIKSMGGRLGDNKSEDVNS